MSIVGYSRRGPKRGPEYVETWEQIEYTYGLRPQPKVPSSPCPRFNAGDMVKMIELPAGWSKLRCDVVRMQVGGVYCVDRFDACDEVVFLISPLGMRVRMAARAFRRVVSYTDFSDVMNPVPIWVES